MEVIKRDGRKEEVSFDKITGRLTSVGKDLEVNHFNVAQKVISRIYDKVTTTELDELAAKICQALSTEHLDYGILASRIIISNNHKNTLKLFSKTIEKLYYNTDTLGNHSPLIAEDIYHIVMKNAEMLDSAMDYSRDFNFDYFSYKTLERAYLLKMKGIVVERIGHLFMRVSVGLHKENIERAIESYNLMTNRYFTHATPTLFHAGTPKPAYLSCFLLGTEDDLAGMYKTVSDCAMISKWAGGIGIHMSNIRSKGAYIRGTNGRSNGIVPLLRVLNNTARHVDQCFDGKTIVYTNEGIKFMEDLVPEDLLVTNDGTLQKVKQVLTCSHKGDMYNIKTDFGSVRVTEEHPFYAIQHYPEQSLEILKSKIKSKLIKPDYISAKNLNKNHLIGYPIPKYEKDIEIITTQDCLIYGILLSSNTIINSNKILVKNCSKLIIDTIIKYCDDRMIEYQTNKTKIQFKINDLCPINKTLLFDKMGNKRIHKNFLHFNFNKSKNIIFGYKMGNERIHKNIIEGIRYILLRNEILTSIKNNNLVSNKDYLKYNGMFFVKINDISIEEDYDGVVYDLEMETNHNYLTHGGLVHNGGGKRPGSFAIYLEPHHPEFMDFLELKKNHGAEEERARDLFLAVWLSDLFMERVRSGGMWSFFDPDECPGLQNAYGEKYKTLYTKYEEGRKARRQIPARTVWNAICTSQIETGVPYIGFKDNVNTKNNQSNLGTIKSSNLCIEIMEYSDSKEYACCCLSSICLPRFVEFEENGTPYYNYAKLIDVCKVVVRNLNCVIDGNHYPVPETKRSNMRHRPLGIGVQGLADTFMLFRYPFDSPEARKLNRDIFEALYYGCLRASNQLAIEREFDIKELQSLVGENKLPEYYDKSILLTNGRANVLYHTLKPTRAEMALTSHQGAYETFNGCPMSKGHFQFDLWNTTPSARFRWEPLRESIMRFGTRNSLLIALMPTASTSQIMGSNECIEPFTSNIYTRNTTAGTFVVMNKYMVHDLMELGLWSKELKDMIIAANGSIQGISGIPDEIKALHKNVWELKQRVLIDMSADRGPFICQTQSLNLFFEEPTVKKLSSALFYGWSRGLKTGSYYIRSRPKSQAQQFTIDPEMLKRKKVVNAFLEDSDDSDESEEESDNDDVKRILKNKMGESLYKICESCTG